MTKEIRSIIWGSECEAIYLYPNHPWLDGVIVMRFQNGFGVKLYDDDHAHTLTLEVIEFFGPGDDDWDLVRTNRGIDRVENISPLGLARELLIISKL
jgi:hypothetical protein